jgi:hypothetical protein
LCTSAPPPSSATRWAHGPPPSAGGGGGGGGGGGARVSHAMQWIQKGCGPPRSLAARPQHASPMLSRALQSRGSGCMKGGEHRASTPPPTRLQQRWMLGLPCCCSEGSPRCCSWPTYGPRKETSESAGTLRLLPAHTFAPFPRPRSIRGPNRAMRPAISTGEGGGGGGRGRGDGQVRGEATWEERGSAGRDGVVVGKGHGGAHKRSTRTWMMRKRPRSCSLAASKAIASWALSFLGHLWLPRRTEEEGRPWGPPPPPHPLPCHWY